MSVGHLRECAVCGHPLIYSPKLDAWRCAFCQRHSKRKRDVADDAQNPNITLFEDVEVDST